MAFEEQLRTFRGKEQADKPITLPVIALADIDIEREAKDAAARVIERKVIRAGIDAWQAIGKAESFGAWKSIGAALCVGKAFALRTTGANAAWGRNYSRAFCDWLKAHGFDRMPKSVRSVAIELHENIHSIEAWRTTLSERDRRRLVHPLSNVRRWRASLAHGNGKSPDDFKRDAVAALKRSTYCLEALPTELAQPLRQQALATLQASDGEGCLFDKQ
jgi:hypothetical protein